LYNEAGLQHELGFYLRSHLPSDYKVQLERNIVGILGYKKGFHKTELDLFITNGDKKINIELKLPVNQQVPRRMEYAVNDVRFLEELKDHGFDECYFLFVSHVRSFWNSRREQKIYEYFNDGIIKTLTPKDVPEFIKSSKHAFDPLKKEHPFEWRDLVKQNNKQWRYFMISV
jgi:hypothetical protein